MARMEMDRNLKKSWSWSPCVLEAIIMVQYSLFKILLDIFLVVFYKYFLYNKDI